MDNKDYVFKKTDSGVEYVGDFDGLYKNVRDPWGQLGDEHYQKRGYMIVDELRDIKPKNVLDIGCGLGSVTQLIGILVTRDVIGTDVSEEAVKRARKMFPTIKFEKHDIINDEIDGQYDAIVLSRILWYILKDIDDVMERICRGLSYRGHLIIFQTFLYDQQWGKDIIDGYKGFLKYICGVPNYRIIKSVYCNTASKKQDSITVMQRWGDNGQ